ncbi:hypothetical protein JCM9279_001756 [Rhodotorula babjevae]
MTPPSPSSSTPPTAPARPRRLPSRRVSALVSHFESAAAPTSTASASSTSGPSTPRAVAPRRTTTSETSAAVSRVGDERDGEGKMSLSVKAASQVAAERVGGKAAAAATVVVPASVSPARDGRPTLTVVRPAPSSSGRLDVAACAVVAGSPGAQLGRPAAAQPAATSNSPSSSTSPSSHPSSSPTSSAPPEAAASAPARPPLEPRRPSVTWAELVSPERDSLDLGSDTASIFSSLSAAPLIPSSTPATRPAYPRASSSKHTVLSASTPSTAPVSRFTTTSTSTTATRCVYAFELFARNAEPLVLPELDAVIESLGGAAHFSPMPAPCASEGAGPRRGGATTVGKGEEWELEMLEQRKGVEADEVFGSELEREAWDRWVRGEQPSRWRRLVAPVQRVVSSLARRRRLDGQDESDAHAVAARAAGMSRDEYIRSLKFPPFHLLPHKLTVTDLKANRRRPPPLIGIQDLLGAAANGVLGAASSSMGLKLTSIEGLRDLMQMITLLVSAASPTLSTLTFASTATVEKLDAASSTLRTLFVTVPSVLSLDFVSAFGQALALLLALTLVTLFALYEVYRLSGGWHGPSGKLGRGELDLGEGYDREHLEERRRKWRDSYAWRVAVTFWCSSMYLPLSKLAIGALVWSDDYWVVEDPVGVGVSVPVPLGPADDYYAPTDFCWRTTMRRRDGAQNVNAAFALVPVAIVVLAVLALWFPWRMWQLIQREAPRVDRWTELGERRRDVDAEYERLLDADPSPFSFLYRDYRRRWASFRSIYLIFKLVNVILVVVVQKDNCLFRSYDETYLSVVRQGTLLAVLAVFCIASAISSPYLTRISNSSDVVSRVGYVFLAMLGLLSALSLPGTDPAVVTVNVIVYSLNVYFTLIGLDVSQRLVKKVQRRLDSSIDIFSPVLDVSKHISRRVWQESLAALIMCSPDLAMQPSSRLDFSQDAQLPPYLLHFGGSVAERFIENLKILREIGLDTYADAVRDCESCPNSETTRLRRQIELRHTGPDVYFRPEHSTLTISSYFGRLDVVPFPFVAVFRYDQAPGQPVHLVELEDLELLVEQNHRADVVAARRVRLALRALEDQVVFAPHVVVSRVGATGGAVVERHVSYRMAVVQLKRNSDFAWRGYKYASGFEISLEYADGDGIGEGGRQVRGQRLVLTGPQLGVLDDYQLTPELALLLRRNRVLVEQGLPAVERALLEHRNFFRREADLKRRTLSYSFLLKVFVDDSLSSSGLDAVLRSSERNPFVQELARAHKASTTRLEERMRAVSSDKVRAWWYIVWDDLWRRNHDVGFPAEAFSPLYSSSICYNPCSRAQLEAFLAKQDLSIGKRSYFHSGLLNRLYFYLNEQVFSSTSRAIPIHLSSSPNLIPFDALARSVPHHHSSMPSDRRDASTGSALTASTGYTGGGTSEDDPSVRHRAAFLFEEAYARPSPRFRAGSRAAWARFQVEVRAVGWAKRFYGLEPVVRDWWPSEEEGVVLDLRKGRTGWEAPRKGERDVAEEL